MLSVNPGSMAPLRAIVERYNNAFWVDNCSIHDLMERCVSLYTINSGVGFEALLHEKPVVRFGQSEYDSVTYMCNMSEEDLNDAYEWTMLDLPFENAIRKKQYRQFVDFFVSYCVDCRNVKNLEKKG